MLRSLEAAYAAALLLALVVLWQQLFILRLRTELRRVALKAPKMRPAGPPLTKASMVLENLMTVAGLKKEATEMVEIAKVANLEKVLAEKTVALAKVEDQRQLDDALYEEDPARAEHMRLDVARRTHIAALEAAWCVQIATIEAARKAEVATFLAARESERAVLATAQHANVWATSVEAADEERKPRRTRTTRLRTGSWRSANSASAAAWTWTERASAPSSTMPSR
mmetsp:Transcript_28777/g.99307  ORF Transcript_28777/g.99307 Transcript_28777/m.99307 type:complete len:226 (+) Transcript_28777:1450-2127(+)